MPKLIVAIPKYRKHKATGRAFVVLDGRRIYLGRYGKPESKTEYTRLVAEWQAAGRQHAAAAATPSGHTISALIDGYTDFAEGYYVKNGEQTTTLQHIQDALKPLAQLYDDTPAKDFGPLALKAVREHMVNRGRWCRKTVNKAIAIICRMFKWASENELVPASVFHALKTVSGLRKGRSKAREMAPVKPIPTAYVEAVLSHVYTVLKRQMEALAACRMTLGMYADGRAVTVHADPIKRFDAWLQQDGLQRTLWPGVLELSQDFFNTLLEHAVPLDHRALAALKHSSLALDIYTWLAHRLCRVNRASGVKLSWANLKDQFGPDYAASKDFKKEFRQALRQVCTVYREARVEEVIGGLLLFPSRAPMAPTRITVPRVGSLFQPVDK